MASGVEDPFGQSGDRRDSRHDARAAMRDVDTERGRLGRELATPWWYKLASATLMAVLFIGAGMPYESVSFGSSSTGASLIVLAVVIGPLWLRELLKRTTGASLDRYRNGWTVASVALVGLLLLCVSVQAFADVEFAPIAGAGVGFAVAYFYERRTDQRLARGQFPADRSRGWA